ncbi:MAG: hypothetical protein QOC70_1751 [Verrucomicrobiota bacterium]|jgi:hypothetical protein
MKTLVTLTSLLLATSLSLSAKTIKYPEKDPAFSITLPDGWTAKADKDGNLDCVAGDGSKFSFSIIAAKNITSDDDLKTYLPKLAETMGEGAKLKDLKVGEVKEMMTANKVKLMGLNAHGQTEGVAMVISLAGFAPAKGNYFVLMGAESVEVDKAHDKDMGGIINSISPTGGNAE